jgi:ATP-dependent exoDNAse (exonuclease V) beta subunit|tara:strand:- start:1870 stop:2640 length:771 start_codon:yes stop_codon:yes gene_type:complete
MENVNLEYLSQKYPHERDSHILFDEGPHIYTIDGDSSFTSVTTWNHSHFFHFNGDKIIDKMMSSNNWTKNKYYGKTKQEIKDIWERNRIEASTAGTKMHYDIECFYNNNKIKNDSIEFSYFMKFHNSETLKPYRTEWMVYDKELKLAGSIDMLYENQDGTLDICDWKRCKEIKKHNPWKSAKTDCINHLPDTNFWHYTLQLNTYKYLLEKNYGKTVKNMYLICLHPSKSSYIKYKVPYLPQEINDLMELRHNIVSK